MDNRVKDLLDRIRGTAGVAADVAADTARVAGRRAGQMVDVAKLNVQLFDLNGEYNEVLRQLGQVMYDTHRGRAPEGDRVTELLEQADERAERIAELHIRARTTFPRASSVMMTLMARRSSPGRNEQTSLQRRSGSMGMTRSTR